MKFRSQSAVFVSLFCAATLTFGATSCMQSPDSPVATVTSNNDNNSNNTPVPSATLDSEEQAFVVLVNNYRAQNGLTALQLSHSLIIASKWMSTDMANNNYMEHTDSLGRDPFQRIATFGYADYSAAGENIAAGYADAADTFTQWKNSPAHNANMLDANYLYMGVGRASNSASTYDWYWTNDFGSSLE